MQNKGNTNLERIIAKIDNDFNPDNSDWIPRVGAWCIQAMQMLDCLPTERKRVELNVVDRIAYSPCITDVENIAVYDSNGCKIAKTDERSCCSTHPSTGRGTRTEMADAADTVDVVYNGEARKVPDNIIAEPINTKEWLGRYNIKEAYFAGRGSNGGCDKNYVIIDNNKIEINFDADRISIEYDVVVTTCSDTYGCEVPVVPNNGLLIEALTYYCIYKMLCRGYKHPVMNLAASQYGTNPYYQWQQLKDEAKRSVLNGNIDDNTSSLFRSNLFIQTFDPRH